MLKGFVSGEEKDIKRIPMKGKNLYNIDGKDVNNGYVNDAQLSQDGTTATWGSAEISEYIPISGDTTYTFNGIGSYNAPCYGLYDENKQLIGAYRYNGASIIHFTSPNNARYFRFTHIKSYLLAMVVEGSYTSSAMPDYEPYGYQEGWEVRDNQDRLIWGREDELQTATGTLPFKGYALPVKVKSLLGNAVQNGTPAPDNIIMPEMCGVKTRNVLDISKARDTSNVTISQIENGIHAEGRYYFEIPFEIESGNYYLSWTKQTESGTSAVYMTFVYTDDTVSASVYSGSFTLEKTVKTIRVYVSTGGSASVNITNIMLNLGSTALPYEPYGWKIPFENHGENLFNIDGKNTGNGYQNNTQLYADGSTAYWSNREISEYITVDGDTQYTLTNMGSYNAPAYCFYTENKEYISGSGFNGRSVITFTTPSNCKYVRITHVKTQPKTMLNAGSTAKPYSPYLNATIPVYLGEVPTVRRVRKLVLDGTEDWIINGNDSARFFYTQLSDTSIVGTDVICTHFPSANIGQTTTEIGIGLGGAIQLRVRTGDPELYTVDSWKLWLSTNKPTIWYVLANEQTGIVNEPLCKIGTYADELTTIQVHGLSAPLYGIGDYKDTLNLSTGVVTRKVKKLVLDGTETWYKNGNTYLIRFGAIKSLSPGIGLVSTHYPPEGTTVNVRQYTSTYWSSTPTPVIGMRDENYTTVDTFKAFLAAQYAAGTPVTIWYVLDTPETETVTVPTGMTGEIEGYLTQVSTPSPTNRSVPKWNGEEETGGTYAVTVYTPPEIPTTTGQNTLTVETNLAPSKTTVKGHIKELT